MFHLSHLFALLFQSAGYQNSDNLGDRYQIPLAKSLNVSRPFGVISV